MKEIVNTCKDQKRAIQYQEMNLSEKFLLSSSPIMKLYYLEMMTLRVQKYKIILCCNNYTTCTSKRQL